jgi:hypothetical protein
MRPCSARVCWAGSHAGPRQRAGTPEAASPSRSCRPGRLALGRRTLHLLDPTAGRRGGPRSSADLAAPGGGMIGGGITQEAVGWSTMTGRRRWSSSTCKTTSPTPRQPVRRLGRAGRGRGQPRDRPGAGRRRPGRLHPGLASRPDAAFPVGRRRLARALRAGQLRCYLPVAPEPDWARLRHLGGAPKRQARGADRGAPAPSGPSGVLLAGGAGGGLRPGVPHAAGVPAGLHRPQAGSRPMRTGSSSARPWSRC